MCGRYNGVAHEIATAVSDQEKAAMRKLLRKPGAVEEFVRRFGIYGANKGEAERIAKDGDMASFFAHLVAEGPAMRVEWEVRDRDRLSYENSSVALYVFAGSWFVSVYGSRLSTSTAYSTPRKAIQPHLGCLKFDKEQSWSPDCGVYRSMRSPEGMKHISPKIADEIVSELTSILNPIAHGAGGRYELLWGEVYADTPYFDSCHDEVGKAVRQVQTLKSTKGKKKEYLNSSLKLKELMMAQGYQQLMFRRGEPGFRGVADSVIKRVGFSARGRTRGQAVP